MGTLNHLTLQVEVSVAFRREEAAAFYEPHAPRLAERLDGIRGVCAAGMPLVLRIDPLFPRSPLPIKLAARLSDFGLPEAQILGDPEQLIVFAKEMNVDHVVYSALTIGQPRRRALCRPMQNLLNVYRAISTPNKPVRKGGSLRLPNTITRSHLVEPFGELCRQYDVSTKFCMTNIIETG